MLAFIFPGQGSQKLNMIQDFYKESIVQHTFEEASDALNFNVMQLITEDEAALNQTAFTQPAILAASIALYRLWELNSKRRPQYLAGHSLGEYTALVAAGVLSFQDAVKLVQLRGQLMQKAVAPGQGAMAAILGLDDQGVINACAEAAHGEVVSAVNFNSPGQVVIAGEAQAVTRAIETAKALGAKRALSLPVSVPSHCLLMKSAALELARHLETVSFHAPAVPIVQNVDGEIHDSIAAIKDALVKQLYSPVQWVKCVQKLAQLGVSSFVECGPGKVLSGLNKRILPEGQFLSLEDQSSFEEARAL